MFLLFPILTKSNFNAFKCKQIKPKKTNTPNQLLSNTMIYYQFNGKTLQTCLWAVRINCKK